MKLTLPERLAGTKDALFVLEVEFPVATEERLVQVETQGAVEALDLRGTGPGGSYQVPVGLERLHVPMRVTDDATGEVGVKVSIAKGPGAPASEQRTLLLEQGPTAAGAPGGGGKLAIAAVLLALVGGGAILFGSKLFGSTNVPEVAGQSENEAIAALQKAKYVVDVVVEDVDDESKHNVVLRTIPGSGEKLAEGERVQLVIGNVRARQLKVDPVVGQTADRAIATLRGMGFQVQEYFEDARPGQEPGRVVRQSPARDTLVQRGTLVEIWITRDPSDLPSPTQPTPGQPEQPTPGMPELPDPGPAPTQPGQPTPGMPELPDPGPAPTQPGQPTPGMPELPDPGPAPTQPGQPTPTPPVMPEFPDPTPGQPEQPTPSNVVKVPDLAGLALSAAEAKLEAIGLFAIPEYETTDDASMDEKVLRQLPEANGESAPGQQVFLTLGRYVAPTQPTPGQPEQPMPGQPEQPMPGQPEQPMPGQPEQPMPGQPEQPMPGQPEQPMPGQPEQPMPGQPEQPTPGQPEQPTPAPMQPAVPGKVPDLIGLARSQATGLVRRSGFKYDLHLEETTDVPDGQVLSQKPGPGDRLELGRMVHVTIARAPGPKGISVPDVMGKSRGDAAHILRATSFLVRTTWGGSSEADIGLVTSQSPAAGTEAGKRTWVEIVVGKGGGAPRKATGGPPPPLPGSGPGKIKPPSDSGAMDGPPAGGPDGTTSLPETPSGAAPVKPVEMPGADAPASASVPELVGQSVHAAIERALQAGLIPIVQIKRKSSRASGEVVDQRPKAGSAAKAGAIVRIGVHVPPASDRYVDVPTSLGGLVATERTRLSRGGTEVEVREIRVPGHPYAGTGRVAGQFPVSSVPRSAAQRITLWVVK